MSPQLLANIAQQALKLYRAGYRVADHSALFGAGEAVRVRNINGSQLCSEAVEIVAVLAALEDLAAELGAKS